MARTPGSTPRNSVRKTPASRPKGTSVTGPPTGARPGMRIRMYRLGVGDCFLVSLPRPDGSPFNILIDCGIHAAETAGKDRIRKAAQDILAQSGARLDVIVGTHEHWDHMSGFFHAPDIFGQCTAGAIWCAWTEDLRDPLARSLLTSRDKGITALWGAMRHLRMAPAEDEPARDWDGLMGFFGDSPGIGPKAKAAADALRKLAKSDADIVYRAPGEPPFDSISDDWRIFVLGPPRDRDKMEHIDPRKGSGEAYPLAASAMAAANLAAAVSADDDPPFDRRFQIELERTHDMPFFRDHYWADQGPDNGQAKPENVQAEEEQTQDWRRIGHAWLDGAETLALQLDKITNNTSLVLAIELGPKGATDNRVILFAADAQIGNWLSWQDVEWPDYAGRKVTGTDLLRRTVIYKVGHHASQNATLMTGGLETMQQLRLALVPTSAEMARKVGWGTLPWPHLLDRLGEVTGDRVLRSDIGATPGVTTATGFTVVESDLCFDVSIPL